MEKEVENTLYTKLTWGEISYVKKMILCLFGVGLQYYLE